MLSVRSLPVIATAGVVLSACGGAAAAANTTDPVATVSGYMQAVQGGDAAAGQPYLEANINDGIPLKGPTTASRYMGSHKGAKWVLVAVPWVDPVTKAPVTTKKACTVPPPQGGQLCIVTVEVDSGSSKVWFHFDTEDRYTPGSWLILNVTEVSTKPDDGLPNGNEAHSS
jgi:hypothetical protein